MADDDVRTDGGAVEGSTLDDRSERIEERLQYMERLRLRRWLIRGVGFLGFLVLFYVALNVVNFTLGEIIRYMPEFQDALGDFFPTKPTFPFLAVEEYWAFLSTKNSPTILNAAVTTLAMGVAGTALGIPGALVFGVLGSERVTPFPFNFLFRGIMSTIRSIPALVWALIYIPLGGLSAFTATLAIGTDTIGNLGRLFTDALEEVEDGPIEGVRSTGADGTQTIFFGMLSQVLRPFIAWTMYILEINVRIAVTMGLIGAGGIGGILNTERGLFHFTNMMATILVIFVLVVSVEMISQRTRSYLRAEDDSEGFFETLFRLVKNFPDRMADSAKK